MQSTFGDALALVASTSIRFALGANPNAVGGSEWHASMTPRSSAVPEAQSVRRDSTSCGAGRSPIGLHDPPMVYQFGWMEKVSVARR